MIQARGTVSGCSSKQESTNNEVCMSVLTRVIMSWYLPTFLYVARRTKPKILGKSA